MQEPTMTYVIPRMLLTAFLKSASDTIPQISTIQKHS